MLVLLPLVVGCARTEPGTPPASEGEQCNGADDDLDGEVDEKPIDGQLCYVDADGDTYGIESTAETFCECPAGFATRSGDCDDSDRKTMPGTPVCANAVTECGEPACRYSGPRQLTIASVASWAGNPENVNPAVGALGDIDSDGKPDFSYGEFVFTNWMPGAHDADAVAFSRMMIDWGQVSVAGVGDVNGDGHDELAAMVSPSKISPDGKVGTTWLVLGPVPPGNIDVLSMAEPLAQPNTGALVAAPGDLDGDGFAEVVIGGADNTEHVSGIWVYSGSSTGVLTAPSAVLRDQGELFAGVVQSTEAIGDLNGDGLVDVGLGEAVSEYNGYANCRHARAAGSRHARCSRSVPFRPIS